MNKYQELMNALQEKINIAENYLKNLSERRQKTEESINKKESDAKALDNEIKSLEKLQKSFIHYDSFFSTFTVFLSVWSIPTIGLTILTLLKLPIADVLKSLILLGTLGVVYGLEAFFIIKTMKSYKERKEFIKEHQYFGDKENPYSALQNTLKKKKSRKKELTEEITSLKNRLARLTEIIASDSLKVDTLYKKRNYLEHEFLQALLKVTPLNQSVDATIDQEFINTGMLNKIEEIPTERKRKRKKQ